MAETRFAATAVAVAARAGIGGGERERRRGQHHQDPDQQVAADRTGHHDGDQQDADDHADRLGQPHPAGHQAALPHRRTVRDDRGEPGLYRVQAGLRHAPAQGQPDQRVLPGEQRQPGATEQRAGGDPGVPPPGPGGGRVREGARDRSDQDGDQRPEARDESR
jgi:hypothetical protein